MNKANKSIIYYRKSLMDKKELSAIKKHFYFDYSLIRMTQMWREAELIIARYSIWPHIKDYFEEIQYFATPINSLQQYSYIADSKNWIMDLGELTPKTYFDLSHLPEKGPFVLKGETNSKKSNWDKMMFAQTKQDALRVASLLEADSLIGYQNIYAREYVPLKSYFTAIGGCPISKEFRFFVAYGKVISGGFYWSNYSEEIENLPSPNEVPKEFLQKVIDIIGHKSNFYTIDCALTEEGKWIVIELNDGCFAGLSDNDPNELYKNLKEVLNANA